MLQLRLPLLLAFMVIFIVQTSYAQSGVELRGDNNQFWTLPATECGDNNFCEVRISPQETIYSWDNTDRKLYVSRSNQNTFSTHDLSIYSGELGPIVDFVPFDNEGYVIFFAQSGMSSSPLLRYSIDTGALEAIEFPVGYDPVACNRYTGVLQRTVHFIFHVGTEGRLVACSNSPERNLLIHVVNINTRLIERTLDIVSHFEENQPVWSVGAGLDNKIYVQIPGPETFMLNLPQIDEATQIVIFVYDLTSSVWSYKIMPTGINTVILTALPYDEGIFFNNHPLSNQELVQFDSNFQIVRRFEFNLGVYLGITLNGILFYRTNSSYSDIALVSVNDLPLLVSPALYNLSLRDSSGNPIANFDPLQTNANIDLTTITTSPLKFHANTNPATVGSVIFNLNDVTQTDSIFPYEFTNWTPTPGQYTLTATPYSGAGGTGTAGTPLTIHFTVLNPIVCSSTVLDIPALLTAITSANGTPETDTICLEAGTYTLDAPITSAMTLVGLGAGAEIIGSLQVSGAGRLTLRNVTVNP